VINKEQNILVKTTISSMFNYTCNEVYVNLKQILKLKNICSQTKQISDELYIDMIKIKELL
jgi:hypothetical protein